MTYRQLQPALKAARAAGTVPASIKLNASKETLLAIYQEYLAVPQMNKITKKEPTVKELIAEYQAIMASKGYLNEKIHGGRTKANLLALIESAKEIPSGYCF